MTPAISLNTDEVKDGKLLKADPLAGDILRAIDKEDKWVYEGKNFLLRRSKLRGIECLK